MEKNKIRMIFWGTILLLAIAATAIGILKYKDGFGENGKKRQLLLPIAEKFNEIKETQNIKTLYKLKRFEAAYKNDSIVVYYGDGIKKYKFIFNYSNKSNKKCIEMKYDQDLAIQGERVALAMMENISVLNGNEEGKLFSLVPISYFKDTTLNDDGITINVLSDGILVTICIDSNPIQHLKLENTNDEENETDSDINFDMDNLTNNNDSEGFMVIYDMSKKVSDIAKYNMPNDLNNNDKCDLSINLVSNYSSVDELINQYKKAMTNTEIETKKINKINWTIARNNSFFHTTSYTAQKDKNLVYIEMMAQDGEKICDTLLDELIKSFEFK